MFFTETSFCPKKVKHIDRKILHSTRRAAPKVALVTTPDEANDPLTGKVTTPASVG